MIVGSFDDTHCLRQLNKPKAYKACSLTTEVEAIWPGQDPIGCRGPPVLIVFPLLSCSCGEVFVSGVVVNNGDGTMGSGELVVVVHIVRGISRVSL